MTTSYVDLVNLVNLNVLLWIPQTRMPVYKPLMSSAPMTFGTPRVHRGDDGGGARSGKAASGTKVGLSGRGGRARGTREPSVISQLAVFLRVPPVLFLPPRDMTFQLLRSGPEPVRENCRGPRSRRCS